MCKFLCVLRHFHFATSTITHHFASPLRISLHVLPVRDFTVRTSRFTHTNGRPNGQPLAVREVNAYGPTQPLLPLKKDPNDRR